MADDSNQLLREIRDLLAAREGQYDRHPEQVRAMYQEQLDKGATDRNKSMRMLFMWIAFLVAAATCTIQFS